MPGKLNDKGQEVLDPNPVVLSVGPRPLTMAEKIQRMVRVQLSEMSESQGNESFKEFNDFECDDDWAETDHISGHEVQEMSEEFPDEARLATTGQSEATPSGETSEASVDPNGQNEGAQGNLTPEEQRTFVQLLTKVYGSPPDNNQ